jgi:thiol-disulfide isomerase/thioredoxin
MNKIMKLRSVITLFKKCKSIIALCISLLTLISSCKSNKKENFYINGNVKNLQAKTVYLIDAFTHTLIDSAEYKNNYFQFVIKNDSNYLPQAVSIFFHPVTHSDKKIYLGFKNFVNSKSANLTSFFLENTNVNITGEFIMINEFASKPLDIIAGIETANYYRYGLDFGYIGSTNVNRTNILENYKRIIKKQSNSYYLVEQIRQNSRGYSNEELESIMTCFNNKIQESKTAKEIYKYMEERPDVKKPLKANITLEDDNGVRKNILNETSKFNIIVFWATWCGPCIEEIELVRKINEKYIHQDINVVSISTDTHENIEKWQAKLKNEKMPWPQFIIDSTFEASIKGSFEITKIPLMLVIDKKGQIIKQFIGYDKGNDKKYFSFLDSIVAQKK